MSSIIPHWIGYYVGMGFSEHGRSVDQGFDCWGLIRFILKEEFHVDVPSYKGMYKSTRDTKSLNKLIEDEALDWESIPEGQERFGDVIVMKINGRPLHVGMVIEKGRMIHIQQGINSCIESYNGVKWRDRVSGFYRHYHVG